MLEHQISQSTYHSLITQNDFSLIKGIIDFIANL